MADHSPGPWEPFLPGRKFVSSVRNFNSICELNTHDRPEDVVDANARLIAAAPDLLSACEASLAAYDRAAAGIKSVLSGKDIDHMRATVAKAKGVS